MALLLQAIQVPSQHPFAKIDMETEAKLWLLGAVGRFGSSRPAP
jgi:hypothetical protein